MNGNFDYFLILSALVFGLVVVLLINLFKKGSEKSEKVLSAPVRRERISPRPVARPNPYKAHLLKEAPQPPRITTMVFYDEKVNPVAVMSRSTLGAQSWGTHRSNESSLLTAFINASFPTQANEVITLHYPQGNVSGRLSVKAFDEKGSEVAFNASIALRGEDFPTYDATEDLQTWLIEAPLRIYRNLFLGLDAIEQAKLLKLELDQDEFIESEQSNLSSISRLALSYLLLTKLAKDKDFFVRMGRYNRFSHFLHDNDAQDNEALFPLERLIISQTFVQTQKLPFFLVRTATPCAQWLKALKY